VAAAGALALAGAAVGAAPPDPYSWYRLYDDREYAAFEATAGLLARQPDARAVVVSWQPGLLLKAMGDPEQVRHSPEFYKDAAKRAKVLGESSGPEYVVVDKQALKMEKAGKADLSFLDGYRLVLQSHGGAYRLYLAEGA
ncbi:MAG TPA: hypothetical protein VHH36_08590, partial [Candidatus Thermoplasmatota archaeon]|nr:hypothetical protein [Candidatus Thermoplasmatota archaeon]